MTLSELITWRRGGRSYARLEEQAGGQPSTWPDIPCPMFNGKPVTWGTWDYAPVLSHGLGGCDNCPAEQVHIAHCLPLAKGPHTSKTIRLSAVYCPGCRRLAVLVYGWHEPNTLRVSPFEAPHVICDPCDMPAAFGATIDEARANLVILGGRSDVDADWDLCANDARSLDEARTEPVTA